MRPLTSMQTHHIKLYQLKRHVQTNKISLCSMVVFCRLLQFSFFDAQGLETSGLILISGLRTFVLSMKFHIYTGSQDHPFMSKVVHQLLNLKKLQRKFKRE